MRRTGKVALVWTTVLLLAVDPVSACRWRARWRNCSPCQNTCYWTSCASPCTPAAECATCTSDVTVPDGTLPDGAVIISDTVDSSAGVLPQPEATPTPAPGPAPTANWNPSRPPGLKPAPAPAPGETPKPKPAPTPADPDLDDLFNEEASTKTETKGAKVTEAVDAPVAESKEEVEPEPAATSGIAGPADDVDFEDAAADADQPGKADMDVPAGAAGDVDFMDAAPGDADDPAEDLPSKGMPADDATEDADEDDATLMPENPAVPKSTEVDRHEDDAALVQSVTEQPAVADGMRLWTDNTGKHQVRARLVMVIDGKVRLQKETGRFTTVPFERLSLGDLAFVQRQGPSVASAGPHQTASNQTVMGR